MKRSRGYTLINVLVAMVVAGLGLLVLLRAVTGITAATTQNEILATLASLSNGFWGAVQASPAVLVTPSLSGTTYTASNTSSAPPALQAWLRQATQALPGAAVTVKTGPDPASGTPCAVATGCAVTLQLSWTSAGVKGAPLPGARTRTQLFYYQFGL